jgi:hypothetical protein
MSLKLWKRNVMSMLSNCIGNTCSHSVYDKPVKLGKSPILSTAFSS